MENSERESVGKTIKKESRNKEIQKREQTE